MDGITLSLLLGALFILIGVIGGGFQAKELNIPKVPAPGRLAALLVGIAFCFPFVNREFIGWSKEPQQIDSESADGHASDSSSGDSATQDDSEHGVSIAQRYSIDHQPGAVVEVAHISGQRYTAKHPHPKWPWVGELVLTNNDIAGTGRFLKSKATMRLEGTVRADGSISVAYVFQTDDAGRPTTRVDRHVWYP